MGVFFRLSIEKCIKRKSRDLAKKKVHILVPSSAAVTIHNFHMGNLDFLGSDIGISYKKEITAMVPMPLFSFD